MVNEGKPSSRVLVVEDNTNELALLCDLLESDGFECVPCATAGQALIDFAFHRLRVIRIIATTEYENEASQAVMRKLGMRVYRNPQPTPFWMQLAGISPCPKSVFFTARATTATYCKQS